MRPNVKTLVGMLVWCSFSVSFASAQNPSGAVHPVLPPPSGFPALGEILSQSVAGRVQLPVAFGTRDSVFSLSLPQDEPAEVYVQLTVGRNGKVREKLTRVNSNHIGTYVAPVFLAAVKGLRVDPQFCARIQGKDTLLTLTFPVRYQCVLDTVNKEMPSMEPKGVSLYIEKPQPFNDDNSAASIQLRRDQANTAQTMYAARNADWAYRFAPPTRVWYYIAFLGDPQE